ncbi:MAG: putative enoyl-CoA hydratase echA8 [Porticoccaceae bacterium UBA1117]|nr:MAG: putative enoyl-CoA hydratase echA8 [Porticoccaceae bacterium UBA1117]
MDFSSDVITIEKTGAVGTIWLDRPDKYNALSEPVWLAIPEALKSLEADADIRSIIVAGRGKHFCVGIDLVQSGMGTHQRPAGESEAVANLKQLQGTSKFQASISSLAECPLPVIAVVHGHCLGAGIDMITACDIRIAAADSNFSVRETRIGLVADVGTLQRLPKILNAGHVAELAYSAKDINAARAEKIGLVNDVYETFDAAYAEGMALATIIAANPPMAVRGTKFMLQQGETLTTEQSLLMNGMFTMITSLKSNDLQESMHAFAERRPPVYTGT